MQRINLFPSPGFLNGIWGSANHTVDNGEMKVLADGGNYSAVTVPATGSQKKNRVVFHNQGVYSQPQLELASTYDAALGGGGILASSPATPCHSADAAHRDGDAR